MTIRMYFGDHAPPHFHVIYNEYEATISIVDLSVAEGSLPRRVLALAVEWGQLHRAELLENWHLCASNQQPKKIQPLED